jgi:thiol:disulfide interchange protein
MSQMVMRLSIVVVIGVVVVLLVWLGRRFVEAQRRKALAAAPLSPLVVAGDTPGAAHTSVRILAFKSADCRQCRDLQEPALQRVLQARQDTVTVVNVDATSEQELVQTYRVLTVPSTVILDAKGQARAINYGFADTQRLLEQIDEVLVANGS